MTMNPGPTKPIEQRTGMNVRNTMTNLVGRTKNEFIVPLEDWKRRVWPTVERLMSRTTVTRYKALIGRWVVGYAGNDAHMEEFFLRNWKKASPDAQPATWAVVLTGISDSAALATLKNVAPNADPKMLAEPFTVYCAAARTFVTINTNYYGQLKSKSSLGPLEEYLIDQAQLNGAGHLTNPTQVWLSLHAGCVEWISPMTERQGIIIIAPTGTGKSTSVYGLTAAKPGNKLHSDDWAFVNAGTLETVASEDQFYMRTNIAEIFPHYIPLLVNQPLENVPFTPDIIALIERYPNPEAFAAAIQQGEITRAEYDTLVAQMIKNSAARSLIDPRLMVGPEKFSEETTLRTILLMKRDFLATMIVKRLTAEAMVEIMTSEGNVFNHVYGQADPDGYGIPQAPTTEIYYNPYLCQVLVERKQNRIGPLDQKRLAAYRALAEHPQVRTAWVNTRLPARQTQFCLRKFLDGQCEEIRLVKGAEIDAALVKRLGLTTQEKPMVPGRRPMDRVGLYTDGVEVEVVMFDRPGAASMSVAFDKTGKGVGQVKAYSEGTIDDCFKHHETLFARELFGS